MSSTTEFGTSSVRCIGLKVCRAADQKFPLRVVTALQEEPVSNTVILLELSHDLWPEAVPRARRTFVRLRDLRKPMVVDES